MPIDEVGLVDANVLVYLFDSSDEQKHSKAKRFFDDIARYPDWFVTSNQCLREYCSVLIKKKKAPQTELEKSLANLLELFDRVLFDTTTDIQLAAQLCFSNQTPFWDSLIASTMQRHGITTIYTENERDFKKLGLRVVNPLK